MPANSDDSSVLRPKTQILDTTSNRELRCDACGRSIERGALIRITIYIASALRNRVTHRPGCSEAPLSKST